MRPTLVSTAFVCCRVLDVVLRAHLHPFSLESQLEKGVEMDQTHDPILEMDCSKKQ